MRELVRRIEAADIESRVGLGIAELLRLCEHVAKLRRLLGHLGQDVIAGAVENAEHLAGAVAGERLAHRLDDRDAARDRRFEGERHAFALRQASPAPRRDGRAAPCWR